MILSKALGRYCTTLYRFYPLIKCPKKQNRRIKVHEQMHSHIMINTPWNWKIIFPMTILIMDYFNKNKALKYSSSLLMTVAMWFIAFALLYHFSSEVDSLDPMQGMHVCVVSMFMLSYIGRGLVMGRSSAQRVLPKYL
jgi:hypothetical protein